MSDFNEQVIAEFHANKGKVGGMFEGAPMILVHHVGRKSGTKFVTPLVYRQDAAQAGTVYIFASAAGAPKDPQWYDNLVAAGAATVEIGTETFPVDVDELRGDDRDRVYDAQAADNPGFAEYAEKTKGIRTIPVLALHRSAP